MKNIVNLLKQEDVKNILDVYHLFKNSSKRVYLYVIANAVQIPRAVVKGVLLEHYTLEQLEQHVKEIQSNYSVIMTDNRAKDASYKHLVDYDPVTKRNVYIRESVYIMSLILEKNYHDVSNNYIVHHRDFNSLNNDPSNLLIFPSQSLHRKYHGTHNQDNTVKDIDFILDYLAKTIFKGKQEYIKDLQGNLKWQNKSIVYTSNIYNAENK